MRGTRRIRRAALLAALTFTAAGPAAADTLPPAGGPFALPSPGGCIGQRLVPGDCPVLNGRGFVGVTGIDVPADGRNAYVTGFNSSSVASFALDPGTGAITQLGGASACIGDVHDGNGDCQTLIGGLSNPTDVTSSADGQNVYVVGSVYGPSVSENGAIAQFSRGPDGALVPLTPACFDDFKAIGYGNGGFGSCPNATPGHGQFQGLLGARGIAVAPDGNNIYIGTAPYQSTGAITNLQRSGTGDLAGLNQTYSAAIDCTYDPEGLGNLTGCPAGSPLMRGIGAVYRLTVSPDNQNVYAVGIFGLVILHRDTNNQGALTQLAGAKGCISNVSAGQGCTPGSPNSYGVAVSPNGAFVITAGAFGLEEFARDPTDGSLTKTRCVAANRPGCEQGPPGFGPASLAFGPDGTSLDVADASGTLWTFAFDPASGALTLRPDPADCIQDQNGATFACTRSMVGMTSAFDVAASPTAPFVYVGSRTYASGTPTSSQVAAVAINRAPSCSATSAATVAGTPVAVGLPCTDPNGDPDPAGHALTRSVVDAPGHGSTGTVDQAARAVTYTPASGFTGTDTFTFRASDGGADAAPATATVTVGPPPPPPPAPPATTTTTTTTSPVVPPLPTLAHFLPAHVCASRRHLVLHLKAPAGVSVASVRVRVGHRTPIVRSGRGLTTAIDLRGLPRTAVKVTFTFRLTDGRTVTGTRTFHTCVTKT